MNFREIRTALLVAGVLAIQACAADYPQSALHPVSDFAERLDDLFRNIFWWAIGVFVVVESLLFYALFRYRQKGKGDRERPHQVHGHTGLELAWTVAPALILVAIAIPTIRTIFVVDNPPEDESLVIEVTGKQWWWEFRYPEHAVVTANEAHVPVGRQVQFRLRSSDVIHSFWVPRLGGKRDLVPGRETQLWFTADSAGSYWGQCAEYCGIAHALMKFRVIAVDPEEFEAWVGWQRRPAAEPDSGLALDGKELFLRSACIGCHRVEGTPAVGIVGPDLTHVGSRETIAAGILENTPRNMARWIQDPQEVKPGNTMPALDLDDEQIARLVAYLQSLR